MNAKPLRYTLAAFADEADTMLDGQIRALKRNAVSLLEIRGVDGKNVSDLSVAEAKEIKKRLDGADIPVWSVGSPVGKIDIRDDFLPHYDKYCRTLEIAHILGAENLRMFSFYHKDVPFSDTLKDEVLYRLSRFCDGAKGSGVTLCHENEKGIYGDTAAGCLDLYRALPDLKAVFDPANFVQCGQNVRDAWAVLYPYVKYLHVKDVGADGVIVPAGYGVGEIPFLVRSYLANGGRVLTLEPHLTVFDGLAALEQSGNTSDITSSYATADEAFDAAAIALSSLLERTENV